MQLFLDIVCNYEFLWDHEYLDHYIPCSIHEVIEVEIFDVYSHVSVFDVIDDAVNM